MKVFLDTNVWVSALATRGLCADLVRVVLAEHQVIVDETVLAELHRVLRRKLRLSAKMAAEIEAFLRDQRTVVAKGHPVGFEIRDPTDAQVLAEAIAAGADVLVTGDRDLLDVAAAAPLPIVTPRGLWELLRTSGG